MSRRLLVAVAVVLASAPAAQAAAAPVAAQTQLAPLVHGFADPVTATVSVSVDPRAVDPASVRVAASFGPYVTRLAGVSRSSGGPDLVLLRFSYRLRCFSAACVPRGRERSFALPAARVSWRTRTGRTARALVPWPPLTVASRLTPQDLAQPAFLASTEPPPATYSVPPGPLGVGLLALGAALAAAGLAGLALLLRPKGLPVAVEPLRHALELVERSAAGDVVDRRRALYRLALALEHARFEPESWAARKLAWAPATPDPDGMRQLALVIRDQLEEAA